jgi:hypothetical protein
VPAMHDIVHSAMLKELYRKRDIYLRTLHFDMTHEECIRLVAPPEHVDILTKAAEFADLKSSENWMQLSVPSEIDGVEAGCAQVLLQMRTHAQKSPPLVPRTPFWQVKASAAGDKVISWMCKRFEIGRRFGTVAHVLHRLNMDCENGHQLRYMFPALLHLCKAGADPKMDKWMEKHAAYKPCRHTPAVSPDLKRAIQDSGALLTSCSLMGDDVPSQLPGFVAISETSMQGFKIGTALVSRM